MKKAVNNYLISSLGMLFLIATGCSQETPECDVEQTMTITATIEETAPATRSCIDGATLNSDFIGMLWEPGDVIGVYGTSDANTPFTNTATVNAKKTGFSGQPSGMIQYAYFPYSQINAGKDVNSLTGILPESQNVYSNHHIDADYKYGIIENGIADTNVRFKHLLSLARLEVEGAGSSLSDETLEEVVFTAERNGQSVIMSGEFNFSAVDGSINYSKTTGNVAKAVWMEGVSLNNHITGFMSFLPTLKTGDNLHIELLTSLRKVSFNVTVSVDFAGGTAYVFPLKLTDYEGKEEYGWVDEPRGDIEIQTGTFTCAAMNVDGLPVKISGIDINKDGPGSDGTKVISNAIASAGWDFFAVSEDFEYDIELKSALSSYNSSLKI